MRLNCAVCTVRHWVWSDKDSLVRHANNPKVWRNLLDHFPHPYSDDDALRWLSHVGALPEPTQWAIDVDGQAVGGIGVELGQGNYSQTGQFGYWLGEDYWGRGIMSAAVSATVEYVFSAVAVGRLEARVFEWNPASMRILEKCGFVREAVLRKSALKDGHLIDTALYARLK